jgi:DNA-binding LytR/AlgR family response regulator
MTRKNRETASAKAKVLIVDDHPVVREGLAMHLATQPDLEVGGEAEDLAGALALVESARPDVAIIDISLKNSNGIELIRRIKDRHDDVRIKLQVLGHHHTGRYLIGTCTGADSLFDLAGTPADQALTPPSGRQSTWRWVAPRRCWSRPRFAC